MVAYPIIRGNDAVMTRGTFANIRLVNKLMSKPGPNTLHIPTGKEVTNSLIWIELKRSTNERNATEWALIQWIVGRI